MTECYYHLDNLPPLPQIYIDEAVSASKDYWFKTNDWHKDSNAWRFDTSFTETGFFKEFRKKYGETNVYACYLKNDPMQGYEWHTDKKRTCVINYLLTENDPSYVIFREKINYFYFNIIATVPYVVGHPFVFNAQIEHSVFNLSNKERFIMSIGFYGPTYEEVRDYILNEMPVPDSSYNY
jgi:hypothetical protein